MKFLKVEIKKITLKDVYKNFWLASFVALLWVNIKKYFDVITTMPDFLVLLAVCFWGGIISSLGFSFHKNPLATIVVLIVPFILIEHLILTLVS